MTELPTKIILEWYDDNGGYWGVKSNLKHHCIAAHGATPQEALKAWMDLWMWDNIDAQKYIQHCCHCDSPVKLTCPDCLVGKQTLIQRGKIWAETFDGITWQIHEIDDDMNMKTIGEIDGDWVAHSTLPKSCIVADGKTPEEALDGFIDLYTWED